MAKFLQNQVLKIVMMVAAMIKLMKELVHLKLMKELVHLSIHLEKRMDWFFTNSDFNVTCKDIGFKKQTKFDVENNNYQIEFEPKQGKSQKLIKGALEGIIASLTKILNDL